MGFKFRKSINLGGGVRINLSKSGVGYSWGGKGYRVTKTAKGTTRATASIPGTGLSYAQEFGGNRKQKAGSSPAEPHKNLKKHAVDVDNNHYDTQEIKNANAKYMVSEGLEEMLGAARQALLMRRLAKIAFWVSIILSFSMPLFWLLVVAALVMRIYVRKTGVIDLQYTFEDDQATEVDKRMEPLLKIADSKKLWWISETSKVIDRKYAAGASESVARQNCFASKKAPFPFKTNATVVAFKSGKETLVFLPDKLFLIQGVKVGALKYSELTTSVGGQRFIERETVPKDAMVVDYTWQYVNKSGGPDKRFQNNRQIPVCLYGKMKVRSETGLNTDIMFSNVDIG